jgi:hypothetical protein
MFEKFKHSAREGDFWGECLLRGKHLRLVLDETNNHQSGEQTYRNYINALQQKGYTEDVDFFPIIKPVDILKNLHWSREEDPYGDPANSSFNDPNSILVRRHTRGDSKPSTVDIRDVSWIFNHLATKPPKIYRVYVKPDKYDDAINIDSRIQGETTSV